MNTINLLPLYFVDQYTLKCCYLSLVFSITTVSLAIYLAFIPSAPSILLPHPNPIPSHPIPSHSKGPAYLDRSRSYNSHHIVVPWDFVEALHFTSTSYEPYIIIAYFYCSPPLLKYYGLW